MSLTLIQHHIYCSFPLSITFCSNNEKFGSHLIVELQDLYVYHLYLSISIYISKLLTYTPVENNFINQSTKVQLCCFFLFCLVFWPLVLQTSLISRLLRISPFPPNPVSEVISSSWIQLDFFWSRSVFYSGIPMTS